MELPSIEAASGREGSGEGSKNEWLALTACSNLASSDCVSASISEMNCQAAGSFQPGAENWMMCRFQMGQGGGHTKEVIINPV